MIHNCKKLNDNIIETLLYRNNYSHLMAFKISVVNIIKFFKICSCIFTLYSIFQLFSFTYSYLKVVHELIVSKSCAVTFLLCLFLGRGDTALVIDKPTYHDKDLQKVRLQLLAVIDQDIRLDVQDVTPLFFLNIRYKQSYTIFSTLYAF